MKDLVLALVVGFSLAWMAFRQWLRQQSRWMIHAERLAAIEKGLDPPPYPEEPGRSPMNVRRVLLLSGLVWSGIGIGAMIAGSIILADPAVRAMPDAPPPTAFWGGLIPVLVGLAHLVVFFREK